MDKGSLSASQDDYLRKPSNKQELHRLLVEVVLSRLGRVTTFMSSQRCPTYGTRRAKILVTWMVLTCLYMDEADGTIITHAKDVVRDHGIKPVLIRCLDTIYTWHALVWISYMAAHCIAKRLCVHTISGYVQWKMFGVESWVILFLGPSTLHNDSNPLNLQTKSRKHFLAMECKTPSFIPSILVPSFCSTL